MTRIEQYASWLDLKWPKALVSLREGLQEPLTSNRLGLPSGLRGCLHLC
jgi:hypothetical protein